MNGWTEVTKSKPCPACGKPDYCATAPDGNVRCMRPSGSRLPPGYKLITSLDKKGGVIYGPVDDKPATRPVPPPPPLAKPKHPTVEAATAEAALTVKFKQGNGWMLAASWAYCDCDGREYARVLRFNSPDGADKSFRPLHAVGCGWNMGDPAKWLPYRVNELAPAGVVLVVEGEKCADAAWSLGFQSVTSSHGAASASKTDWSAMAGREVVIWPDRDDAGASYAARVAELLNALNPPAKVRVITPPADLPDGGDIADFIESRDAAEPDDLRRQVQDLIAAAAPPVKAPDLLSATTTARAFMIRRGDQINEGDTTFLWYRRFAAASLGVLYSHPGAGKSTIGCDMAAHVTNGKAWPDGSPCPLGSVIYLRGEGTDKSLHDRLNAAGANPSRYVLIGRCEGDGSPMIDLARDTNLLASALEQMQDCKLVVVDTLDSLFPSMRMIDNANIRGCLWPLQDLAERTGVAVLLLAHTSKAGYFDPLDRLSGGRAIGGAARAVWMLGRQTPESTTRVMAVAKANDFKPAKSLEYRIDGDRDDRPGYISWIGETELTAWDLDRPQEVGKSAKRDDCVEWLNELLADGPRLAGEVDVEAEAMGYGKKVMKAARAELKTATLAQKGTIPPRYWLCLPGQMPPANILETVTPL